MKPYNDFLSERIKLLADEISKNVTNDYANIQEVSKCQEDDRRR